MPGITTTARPTGKRTSLPAVTTFEDIELEDIMLLEPFIEKYPELGNEPCWRWRIFNRKSNGLEVSGAVLKRFGRWHVVIPRMKTWLLSDSVEAA